MDVIISEDQAYVLEASGRCGATCIPELIGRYYGFNYYEKMIRVSMGEDVSFSFDKLTPCIGKLIISEKDGIIMKQDRLSMDDCTDVQFDYRVGDKVRKFSVGPDWLGHIIKRGNVIDDCSEIELSIE